MSINSILRVVQVLLVLLAMTALAGSALAQRPVATPNPTQRDATRPPGQDQNQPEVTRPTSPTAAPGTQRSAPQAPPGTNVVTPATQPSSPRTALPDPSPTPPGDPSASPTPAETEPREPLFPTIQPRPLPPPPNLSRLGVTSDNTVTLSLNDAIRRALESNNDIEVARDDVRYAETQLRSLEGFYEPFFSVTPQIDKRISPQSSALGGGGSAGTVSTTIYSVNPAVTKFFSTGGGNYSLSFLNAKTTSNSAFSSISPAYSSNLGLTFTQPLWRNRSIDNQRRQIRIQRKRLEQSDADFRLRTIEIISQVQRAYWDLVFALRDQQIQLENLNLSRENLRRVEAQIVAGAKAPLERAEVLTELSNRESGLLIASQNVSIAENALKQLILREPNAREWSAQITPTDAPAVSSAPVDLNTALSEARKNRPELRRLNLQQEINSIDLKYFKNQTRPQIDLQSTLATTGLAGTPCDPLTNTRCSPPPTNLIGGYGKDLSNLFSFNTRNIVVGVAIQFPFRNKTAQADLAGARIQTEQLAASVRSQEQFIEVDVRNAAQAVETARQRVLTARAARESAELQLTGEQRLYEVGRSTTFILFQRENALANARNQELRAETDYNKALADLQRATSTTLRANNVVVENPLRP